MNALKWMLIGTGTGILLLAGGLEFLNTLDFFPKVMLEFIGRLAWPLVATAFMLVFSANIGNLIDRIKSPIAIVQGVVSSGRRRSERRDVEEAIVLCFFHEKHLRPLV